MDGLKPPTRYLQRYPMFDILSELFWFLVKLKCLKHNLIAVLFFLNQVHGTVFFSRSNENGAKNEISTLLYYICITLNLYILHLLT